MMAYIVNMFIVRDGDSSWIQAIWRAGWGGREIQRYIIHPAYIPGLIYGPQEPHYKGFPLYVCSSSLYIVCP